MTMIRFIPFFFQIPRTGSHDDDSFDSFFLCGDSKNNYVSLRILNYVYCIKCKAYRVHTHGRLNDQDFHRAAVAVAAKERAQAGQVDIAFAGDAAKVEFRTFACFFCERHRQKYTKACVLRPTKACALSTAQTGACAHVVIVSMLEYILSYHQHQLLL